MGHRFDRLPGGIQKSIKRLADIEQKILAVLRQELPDEEERVHKLMDQGDRVVEKLFDTQFAVVDIGVWNPGDPDDLQEMAEYLLGEYAAERVFSEESGMEYDEDLFYAGAYLKNSSEAQQGELTDLTEEEMEPFDVLDLPENTEGDALEGWIIPVAKGPKGKKQ